MLTHRVWKESLLYVATLVACLLIFFFLVYPGFNFHLPLVYKSDGLWGSASIKTVIETGWYLTNPMLGAPGNMNLADFPQSDAASFLLIKFFTLFSKDYAVVLNCFYLSTFILSVVATLWVLRILKVQRVTAFAVALLFTFLPYHVMRGENHLFLSTIYVVPLYFLLIMSVYRPQAHPHLHNTFLLILLAIVCAASGVYYAFFGAFFILIAGLFAWLQKGKLKRFIKACLLIGVLMATILANIYPSFVMKHRAGPNHEITRGADDAERFGLKINQMIMPVLHHRLRGFSKSAMHYKKISPLVNENVTSALGIIGSLGLIALLFMLLLRRDQIENRILFLLSRLTVFGILLGTVGGVGAVFAFRVSSMIRAYNRISIFLAFFALLAAFLILQRLFLQANKKYFVSIVVLLTLLGVLDETPATARFTDHYQKISKAFASDAAFVKQIEASMPAGSQLFQLPNVKFPENPTVYQMTDYQQFRPYLHSQQLHWSYGAIKGRQVSLWQQTVSQEALPSMLKKLQQAGFKGIVIDCDGYPDHAAQLIKQVNKILKTQPIVSADQVFVFFSFKQIH